MILWLFHLSMITGIMGIRLENECRGGKYMKMMRRGSYTRWWRQLCMKQIAYTIVSEGIVLIFTLMTYSMDFYAQKECLLAFALLTVHCIFLVIVQSCLKLYFHDVRLSIIVIMILHFSAFLSSSCIPGILLPGSWSMLCRSILYIDEGFNPLLFLGIQSGTIAIIILFGGYGLKMFGID